MRKLAALVLGLVLPLASGCSAPRAYSATGVLPPDRYLPAPEPDPRPPAPPRDLFTRDVLFLGDEALDGGDSEWPEPGTGSWDDGSPVDRGDGVLRVNQPRRWPHRGDRRGCGRRGARGDCATQPVVCAPQPVCDPAVSFRERWQR